MPLLDVFLARLRQGFRTADFPPREGRLPDDRPRARDASRRRGAAPHRPYSPKPTRESRANRFRYATRPSTIAARPSSVSSWCVPWEPDASACSRASALAGETLAAMIGPPAKATSIRTESGVSGNGYDLRENAVDGVGVDKGDLQAEEANVRDSVDQLRARDDADAHNILVQAALYASSRLSEVEARLHYLRAIRGEV